MNQSPYFAERSARAEASAGGPRPSNPYAAPGRAGVHPPLWPYLEGYLAGPAWAYAAASRHDDPNDAAEAACYPAGEAASDGDAPARPLDVIHVGPSLLGGGAEQWLIDLARFLDPKRVRLVRTIATTPGLVDRSLVGELKIPVEIGQADAVRRAARECHVLLCWGLGLNDWLADCRAKLCVFVAHGDGDWTRVAMEQSTRVVDHVVAVSRSTLNKCALGVPATVIWNGVDSARVASTRSRQAVRQSLGFHPHDFVLGYVGRFSREKRPHVVIEAVRRLPDRFKALLLGWGSLRRELMELANEKIPGRFAIAAARGYLGDFYQAMDAVCLVSNQEGFPLVMLEAMMCARPLIVTPVGCVPEVIVDRINGLVVSGDAASVSQAAELLDRYPDWARGVAAAGKTFAAEYGHASRMAREYENLLHGLWTAKHGPLTAAVA